jgi:hypothetical protein
MLVEAISITRLLPSRVISTDHLQAQAEITCELNAWNLNSLRVAYC